VRELSIAITYPLALGVPGGGPLDCIETARHLSAAGARVLVLPVLTGVHAGFPRPAVPPDQAGASQARSLAESGVEVAPVTPHPLHYLMDGLEMRRAIRRLLRERRVDAVLGYWQEAAYLPALLREHGVAFGMIAAASYSLWLGGDAAGRGLSRSRFRQLARGFVLDPIERYLRRPAHRWRAQLTVGAALRRSDFVFARSEWTRSEVVDLFGVEVRRIGVAHCGVDPAFFTVERRAMPEIRNFFYCGALIRRKGIFDAITALGRAARDGLRGWTLKVAGWGDGERVLAAAREQGIAESVQLLGRLDRPALLRELAWAHLAIMPSHTESFGLAIGEAQAAALPVVAWSAGAVPEVVSNGETGWLAPVGHIDALADAIRAAVVDPRATMSRGLAARRRMAERFSWDGMARRMLADIQSATHV
jgi:glycosyltransferase involved in cell wall biosynthesis